ncbi:hypothetical protein KIK06_05855 [Nocardiopsis sp. EMB25]|uniref:hypothetical protein n=1 Tax=Nocardiopsis sp. EMB25 TaxID=2835867 RepID=UPI002284D2B4|nr:hypothetical protein [Nocardiopsis sp. EMB25]MCY9783419.1 hypothetical protein [Nocardiopsis sp. EMB25]
MSHTRRRATPKGSGPARFIAATASAGTALIHLVMTPDHWNEWMLAGVFFVATGVVQTVWAVLAVWPGGRALMAVGALVNLGSVGIWTVSRVVGVPFGPHAWTPEPIGVTDTVAVALELAVAVCAVWAMLRRGGRAEPGATVIGAVVVAALMVAFSTAAAVNGASEHAHGTDSHADDGHTDEAGETGTDTTDPADSSVDGPSGSVEPSESAEPAPGHADDGHDHEH